MRNVPGPVPPAQHLRRLREITTVLVKFGFPEVVARLHLEKTVAFGRRLRPWAARGRPAGTTPERLRQALEALGPTFIKFGQALSTRADLLPSDLVAELSRLQDDVAPLPPGVAECTIEAGFGKPVADLFARFDTTPVAAASIAQVHRAALAGGGEVAVKVRRPGIEATVEQDLAILSLLARLAERYLPDAELYDPVTLVSEFARSIRREMDLAREGRAIERFARNFAGDATVRFPRVHWPRTTSTVLTMEYIEGIRLTDVVRDGAAFDTRVLARRGARLLLQQVLRDGLFHGDPHPANIFVLPGNVICLLDFGNVGRLDREQREALGSLLGAIVSGDAERMTRVVLAIGRPLRPVDADQLRRDLSDIVDGYADVPLGTMPIAALIQDAVAVLRRHRLRLPPDFVLLSRMLVTVEGVGRQLDPAFNMVEEARPIVTAILRDRLSPAALASRAADTGRDVVSAVQHLPGDLVAIAAKARDDRLQIQFVHRNLDHFVQEMDRSSNRLSFAIIIAALIVGSSLILHKGSGPHWLGLPAIGLVGFVAAALLGLWLAVGILRSGRL